MVGYSGTPLVQKLGLKEGATACFVDAPDSFFRILGPLPEGLQRVQVGDEAQPLDFVLLFAESEAALQECFPLLAAALAPAGMLWVAWPKRTSGVETDLSFDVVQRYGLSHDLVDSKVCAIDDVWSGLRFSVRREHRAARAQRF